ncbi:DUF2484 family protein [Rubellimicrobium sp. CFH 75288]|uniref:DUF2484 family protein n=1 Tax=Rubellimicrobium sp. CFH 75288 TaxID=2697034 RepID=UPI00141236BA|nr:DUF2484 family protein [Rubellimicrobium sp. CFH 75288]NAZ36401.1 DUF2484 family protein [Rubellimicrobium sp. CFH 75288]
MSAAAVATLLWFVGANVLAMIPSRDHHRTRACLLIVVGVPLLGWLTVAEGPVWGLLALAGGASVLRWPLIQLGRRLLGRPGTGAAARREPAE